MLQMSENVEKRFCPYDGRLCVFDNFTCSNCKQEDDQK